METGVENRKKLAAQNLEITQFSKRNVQPWPISREYRFLFASFWFPKDSIKISFSEFDPCLLNQFMLNTYRLTLPRGNNSAWH